MPRQTFPEDARLTEVGRTANDEDGEVVENSQRGILFPAHARRNRAGAYSSEARNSRQRL